MPDTKQPPSAGCVTLYNHHFGEVGSHFGLLLILRSLTKDSSNSTWQGTCPLFLYTMELRLGNFRGNTGCNIHMLVGHYLFSNVYIVHWMCHLCPSRSARYSKYINPYLIPAWSCRWFAFSICTLKHCLITSLEMSSTRTWLFVWTFHAKLDAIFCWWAILLLDASVPIFILKGWPSPHLHGAHNQHPEGADRAARCWAWLETRDSTDGGNHQATWGRTWEIQQQRYSGNLHQQDSHLNLAAGLVVMWECEWQAIYIYIYIYIYIIYVHIHIQRYINI